MKVSLGYGHDTIDIDVPPETKILTVTDSIKGRLTYERVAHAIDNPTDSKPLAANFQAGDKVTIVTSDITRPCGADIFLPVMVDRLQDAGVFDIKILFATGAHRGHTKNEWKKITGEKVYGKVSLVDHDASGPDLARIVVDDQTVKLNRLVTGTRKVIITGSIQPHYLAGFGGGRKAIMPGVASLDDAKRFHALSLHPHKPGRAENIGPGIIENNQMSIFAEKVMKAVNPVFLLNTITDSHGVPVDLVAGDPVTAWRRGTAIAGRMVTVKIDEPADLVIASCGGYPKDINFIQAHKTFDNAVKALRPEGKLIMVAKCPDGIGNASFMKRIECGSVESIWNGLRENFEINGQTAMATLEKSSNHDTRLLSDLDHAMVESMGIHPLRNVEEFMRVTKKSIKNENSAIVIPEGAYITPVIPER